MENKRKLVKQGTATLMISLPSGWTKKNNLGKGDEVFVDEDGNDLVITPSPSLNELDSLRFDISGYGILTNRVLMSLYIKGIDEIELTFQDINQIKDSQKKVINELIGFEIIKQSSGLVLIRDVASTQYQDIDEIIKRIFFIIDSMVEELITALEKEQSLKPVIEIDTGVNRFVNFCLRLLNKKGYRDFKKTPQIYGIVSMLEEIGDTYKKIASDVQTKKIEKTQIEIIKKTRASLNIFKELLTKFDKDKELEFARNYEYIKKAIKNTGKIDSYLFQLNETIIKMNNYLLTISL